MNTSVMVALEDDVIAYLDEVLPERSRKNPSEFINELLRREMGREGMAEGENYGQRGPTVEIPGNLTSGPGRPSRESS